MKIISYTDLLCINWFGVICRTLYPFRLWFALISFVCVTLLNVIVFVEYFYIRDFLVVITIWSFYFWLVAYIWGHPNVGQFKKYWFVKFFLSIISIMIFLVIVIFTLHALRSIYFYTLGS